MESLFGSLPEMLEFQKVFLETLEDGISASSDFNILETPSQFRVSVCNVSVTQSGGCSAEFSLEKETLVPWAMDKTNECVPCTVSPGRWYKWGTFLSESQCSGSRGLCLGGDCDPAVTHI